MPKPKKKRYLSHHIGNQTLHQCNILASSSKQYQVNSFGHLTFTCVETSFEKCCVIGTNKCLFTYYLLSLDCDPRRLWSCVMFVQKMRLLYRVYKQNMAECVF